MSCETWSLVVRITSTLFFLSRAASLRPAPPAAFGSGGRARRSAPELHIFSSTATEQDSFKTCYYSSFVVVFLAVQDAESSTDSRSWLDHAHLRIFHFT